MHVCGVVDNFHPNTAPLERGAANLIQKGRFQQFVCLNVVFMCVCVGGRGYRRACLHLDWLLAVESMALFGES